MISKRMLPLVGCVRKAAQQISLRSLGDGQLLTTTERLRCAVQAMQKDSRAEAIATSVRSFHRTSLTALSVRRRRTNTRDSSSPQSIVADDDENSESPRPISICTSVTDSEPFLKAGIALLDKLLIALQPLVPINDNMFLTRGEERSDGNDDGGEGDILYGPFLLIDLGPVDGQYTLTVDVLQHVILFQSPISGQRIYQLSKAGDWCNVEDGHNLEGILVRDLIRQIQGVPKL